MTFLTVTLLVIAIAILVGAEWPRLEGRFGGQARRTRERARQKANLKLLRTDDDDFAASVERDLAELPTIDEREGNGRR